MEKLGIRAPVWTGGDDLELAREARSFTGERMTTARRKARAAATA